MLGYSYKYLVVVSYEYCSNDEEYEETHGFMSIDDALKFIDSYVREDGLSISLFEHKLGVWY